MYIVTNRDVDPDASKPWSERIRKTPNRKGPNELRVLEATRSGGRWSVRIFEDDLTADMKREIGVDEGRDDVHAGTYVAFKLFRRVRDSKRNLLLYVHGFNNDLASVLDRAEGLARNYGVEVVPFSWPANGGGFKGTLDYLEDKRDARASVGALDRVFFFDKFLGQASETAQAEA